MKLLNCEKMNKLILLFLMFVIELVQSSRECVVRTRNFGKNTKIGCEITNIISTDKGDEIILQNETKLANVTDIVWMNIGSSDLTYLQSELFDTFENLTKLFITKSQGVKNLPISTFFRHLKLLSIFETDLEHVGENIFVGLDNLTTLKLNCNSFPTVHKNALSNLEKLTYIELMSNNIEFLHDDTFKNNTQLKQSI